MDSLFKTSKITCIGLIALLVVSCQVAIPLVVVNHRDVPVELYYASVPYQSPNGTHCYLEQVPTVGALDTVGRSADRRDFKPAKFTSDWSRCEFHVTVPPKHSAWIAINQVCDDGVDRSLQNPGAQPNFTYLRIESDGGSFELRGWEVTRALKSHRRIFGDGICRFDFN